MTEITFSSEVTVELVSSMGNDSSVVQAARVSTLGKNDGAELGESALISYLMKNRHGSPFEHNSFTFYISAPIFVFREFHRHRVGWCLAGDTEVWQESRGASSGRTVRKRPIEELYRNWYEGIEDSLGRRRLIPACRNYNVRTLDEATGEFILSKVTDIYKNGFKKLFRVTTVDGQSIRCSKDHQIWTSNGWAKWSSQWELS